MSADNHPFILDEKEPPWKEALALLCTKCIERLPDELKTDEITNLRSWLKTRLKDDGHWDNLRVLTTGCQSYCPKEGICLFLSTAHFKESGKVLILAPNLDRDLLYKTLISKLITR